jgi:acetyltransferase-like isoleucine patch superfamily enzyme
MKLLYKFTTFLFAFLDKKRVGYYRHLYPGQMVAHDGVVLGRYSAVNIAPGAKNARLRIGKTTRFRKFCSITLDAEGKLTIGENTFFNNYCSINCLGTIEIGNNTLFGEGVKIYDPNHVFNKQDKLIENQGFSIGSISIGSNCWIGSNSIILNNVQIGDNVVIGAGCIITKSVAANTIVRPVLQHSEQPILFR